MNSQGIGKLRVVLHLLDEQTHAADMIYAWLPYGTGAGFWLLLV